ncbi:MAG TPA: (2Fe-2S)-binding protein [Nocardioides sp.]|jgi:bacterioferritin-associated ferredoxin|nr:(2Fe-2S)-binding protein [Nocardioides sp.]
MIVCHCRVVTDRDVETAVASGARTVGAVCRKTGAAQECTTCIFSVKAIVQRHVEQECAHLVSDGAAS